MFLFFFFSDVQRRRLTRNGGGRRLNCVCRRAAYLGESVPSQASPSPAYLCRFNPISLLPCRHVRECRSPRFLALLLPPERPVLPPSRGWLRPPTAKELNAIGSQVRREAG